MNLRPKTTRFIIEALDYRIEAYQERLKAEDLDEDEESDLTNDSEFLEAIRTEMAKNLKKMILLKRVMKVKKIVFC